MLAARVEWLSWPLYWGEGRVVWRGPKGDFVPGPADLAEAQRALYKVRKFPVAGGQALGDASRWLRAQTRLLESAKRLCTLKCEAAGALEVSSSDLPALLEAESRCRNLLPASALAALVQAGESAILTFSTESRQSDGGVRALAAVGLGTLSQRSGIAKTFESESPGCLAAFRYGQTHGLPSDPALAANLFVRGTSAGHVQRILQVVTGGGSFAPTREVILELLDGGIDPRELKSLVESCEDAERLTDLFLRRRDELAELPARGRRESAARLRAESEHALNETARLFHDLIASTASQEVARAAARFVELQISFRPFGADLAPGVTWPLRLATSLPVDLRGPFLALLVERHAIIWNPELQPRATRRNPRPGLGNWLSERFHQSVRPLSKLLEQAGDIELVRSAIELEIDTWIGEQEWPDQECLLETLKLARTVDFNVSRYEINDLIACCRAFSPPSSVFRSFRRILAPFADKSPQTRAHHLFAFIDAARETPKRTRQRLISLERLAPILAEFDIAHDQLPCYCCCLPSAFLTLQDSFSELRDQRFRWMMGMIRSREKTMKWTWTGSYALKFGARLANALAVEKDEDFRAIIQTSLTHSLQDSDSLESGRSLLTRIPWALTAFTRVFPQQPLRCMRLLERMGLIPKLGGDCAAPLRQLRANMDPDRVLPPGWSDIAESIPVLLDVANRYVEAAGILGVSADPPPGVSRAFAYPKKLERQLAHLNKRIVLAADSAELLKRRDLLEGRLADADDLRESVVKDVSERTLQASALLQVDALERQVAACYRLRLSGLIDESVGPLDDELMQAAILSANIQKNKKLLRRLLRSHFKGERDWREKHPANAAFLQKLRESGCDVPTWLGRNPYRARLKGTGVIHLYMEDEPLRILPMGSYFNTCLSVDDFNAFSAVANACDLNKRVIYAADSTGRIVGRKLIAINNAGELIGFYTYAGLASRQENRRLRAAFRRYCERFARSCGIAMGESGEVVRLMSEDWYDDGVVAWRDYEEKVPSGDAASSERDSGARIETSTESSLE